MGLSAARTEVAAQKAAYREKLGEIGLARRTAEFSNRDLKRQTELAERKLASGGAMKHGKLLSLALRSALTRCEC